MKRIISSMALILTTGLAQADPVYHPPGSMLTYGSVSNGQTIMSDITNPAAGAATLEKNGNQYRFGILSSVGVGVEFGEVDDLYDAIENEADAFDTDGISIEDPSSIAASVNDSVVSLNAILEQIEADGYAKVFGTVHLPIMPLVVSHEGLGGSFVLDVNGSVAIKAYGLQDQIQFDASAVSGGPTGTETVGDVTIDYDNETLSVDNDSSYVTKAAKTSEIALGYSRPMMETSDATLYAGLRAKYYKVELSREAYRMGDVNDAEDIFDDAKDADFNSDSGLGVDFGVLWVSDHYRLGATLTNANEPSFEYDALDLSGYNSTTSGVGQRLSEKDEYIMERQLKLEASLYTQSQNWVISAAMDANEVTDALGDEYQWASLSAAYATDSWLLPGFRVGYRSNLSGTEISYLTGGLTLFKALNLDIAWSPDSVKVDDESVPRGVMLNLGLELSF